MCRLDIPENDDEVQDRLELWSSVMALDTFGTMVAGRPPSIDSHLTEPLQYFPEDMEGVRSLACSRSQTDFSQSEERFVTLQDFFEGQPVNICGEKPSGYVWHSMVWALVDAIIFAARRRG